MKTGRNHPCPCGSGKKYKQCCLEKDEASARASTMVAIGTVPADIAEELDAASNGVVDLIDAGKLDEAEKAAQELLLRFPDVHDGYDRLGMVSEARGDFKQAAAYYRKVIDFVRQHPDDYDPAFLDGFQASIERLDPPAPAT